MTSSPLASGMPPPSAALGAVGRTWQRFWFAPADSRPLAIVRIGAGLLALAAWWSYAADLQTWFGPDGLLPPDVVRAWRADWGFSLLDLATTRTAVAVAFAVTGVVFALLLVGAATPIVAPLSAVLFASLLHRGPMLAGPADDCLSVLLWCLAVGPAGRHCSVDRWLADRAGAPPPGPEPRAGISRGLLQVHAAAIPAAVAIAQLKEGVWWDGSAAWYLVAAADGLRGRIAGLFAGSEYLTNLVTHAITALAIASAIGVWFGATQRMFARIAVVAWPVVGLLAGEPLWGLALALFFVPLAWSGSPPAMETMAEGR
ncbi:MAG: hypothetical protein RLZZ111_2205 [Planctomycetota bacterium]|jgi:hypothetical protein